MSLFNLRKKKAEIKQPTCACNANVEEVQNESCCESCGCVDTSVGVQNIKILGAGCKSCHEQYENTKEAVANLGLSVEVEYITDMEKVMTYGVMSMPAIVINEKVVSMGKVLKVVEIEKLIHAIGF